MTTSAKIGPLRIKARDREIYRLVDIEGKSQRVVAGEMKLSQPRVNAIMQRMRKWLRMPLPPKLDEGCREDRLREHSRAHRMRLMHYVCEAGRAWEKSKQMLHTVKVVNDGEGKKMREEHVGKETPGNPRFLDAAMKYSLALLEFDGMDTDGSVDLSPATRLPEKTELTREEFVKEFAKISEKMQKVVEQVQREAAVAAAKQNAEEQVSASPSLPSVSPMPAADVKLLSELLSREKAAIQAEKCGDQPVIEPLSEAIEPLSNVIEPLSPEIAPEATEKGSGVFGVKRFSIMEGCHTPKTPDPGLSIMESANTPKTEGPGLSQRSKYAWLKPSIRIVTDEEKRRVRVTTREYPQPEHYYDTRTGKRIEPAPKYDPRTGQRIEPEPPYRWTW